METLFLVLAWTSLIVSVFPNLIILAKAHKAWSANLALQVDPFPLMGINALFLWPIIYFIVR